MIEIGFLLFLVGLLAALLWRRQRRRLSRLAVIDGSNLIYWKPDECSLVPVQEAIVLLRKAGFTPCVIFDANAGYLVADRYMDGGTFARRLGLKERHAHVVPRGEPADPFILQLARESEGIVVSRDKFRDWAGAFSAETARERLVPGGYRDGRLWLDFTRVTASRAGRGR